MMARAKMSSALCLGEIVASVEQARKRAHGRSLMGLGVWYYVP